MIARHLAASARLDAMGARVALAEPGRAGAVAERRAAGRIRAATLALDLLRRSLSAPR